MKLLLFLAIFILFSARLLAGAAPPTEANRFFIVNPNDSIVGTPVTVTIEARRGNDVDTNYQNDVTLVTNGSATDGGLVDIVNGVGTITINDLVAETVTLSLSDTQATGLDTSSIQDVIFSAGGSANFNQQKFLFRDDDGDEITATGFGAENVNQNANIINVAPGTALRLRFAVKLTQADGSIAPRLEFKEGTDCTTGTWTVTASASSVFSLQSSPNFIDGATTTQQLVGGPNFIAGQILESANPASSLNMLKNQSTEYEWSLKTANNTPLGTTYSFRVTNNSTALNTYDQCPTLTTQSPPPPPSGGGGSGVRPTIVTFSGKAFPGAKILVVDKDVRFEKIVSQDLIANEDGRFNISFIGILQSQHSFGLLVKDKENRTTQTKFFNIDTLANDLVVKDMLVPPTVGFGSGLVTRGRNAVVSGYASPESDVIIEIGGTVKKEVRAEKDGSYKIAVGTGDFEFGQHRVRAKQIDSSEKKESDFSTIKTVVVSRLMSPKNDFSGDGQVDIKDWSIFLSHWSSKDREKRKTIDLNGDGRINISDFSVFVKSIRKR